MAGVAQPTDLPPPTVRTSKDQFLRWLEASNMPLTEDGCFIAYKYVDDNYKDGWTHTIDNKIGALIHIVENDLGYFLFRAVERTKLELSDTESTMFNFADAPVEIAGAGRVGFSDGRGGYLFGHGRQGSAWGALKRSPNVGQVFNLPSRAAG